MKFNCDSCGVAYMISDEKVGPNGVRVRCKKCGNQITVRRAAPAVPVAPILERTGPAPAPGLDAELGSAFDQAFGGQPAAAPPAPEPSPPPPVVASPAAAPAPPAQEWYVAIGEAQVGPLPLLEVRKRWEAGDIGPDSLVWRPGMVEWGPLSGAPELASFLAPVPQPRAPAVAAPASVFAAPAPRQAAPPPPPAATGPEAAWRPSGASALASLASEELASREPVPVEKPAPRRSVMEQLPDSGGVDPTGAMPLPLKAMERTGERPVHRSSVARGAEELRHKRTMRTVTLVALLLVVLGGGGAFAWYQFASRPAPVPAPVATAPVVPPPAAAPAPVAPPPAPAPAATNQLTAAATPTPTPATDPAAAAPPPAAPKTGPRPAEAAAPRKARAPAPAAPRPARPAVAQAAPAAPPPPAAKPAPKKKDGLLDFDQGGDDDLAAALGSGAGGRKVYVPPAAGGATAAPDRLSDAQILESVKLHTDDLRRCVTEQQAREPGVRGTIKVAWVIQPDGTPRDVRCLTPEYAQGEFARCMIKEIRGIRFQRVGDPKGQNVTFPFTF